MKTLFKLIKSMFAELTLWGRFWLILGLGTLGAAAAMSFDFGYQVSAKHAVFLGLLSIITAFAPETAYRMFTLGKTRVATVIAIACAPFFVIEFYSHAGYTAGLRGVNVTEGKIQHTKWDGAQDAAKEDKANLEMWKAQLADLKARNKAHADKNNGWLVSVDPTAMQAQMDAMDQKISNEANRVRCGKKCEDLKVQRGQLAAMIGNIKEENDLTDRIEATQRILDKKRDVANATEYKPSAVAEQNEFLSKAVALAFKGDLKPTEVMLESAQQTVSLAMALAGTFLPAFAFFLAGLYRREDFEHADDEAPTKQEVWERQAKRNEAAKAGINLRTPAIQPATSTREIIRTDNSVWRDLSKALNA